MSHEVWCEFEVSMDGEAFLAWPMWPGIEEAVRGDSMQDVLVAARRRLKRLCDSCRDSDRPTPALTLNNRPRHDGIVVMLSYRWED